MPTIDRLSRDYQRAVGELVSREVHYNASTLIYDLVRIEPDNEDLFNICTQDDWQTAAEDVGWTQSPTLPNTFHNDSYRYAAGTNWLELCQDNDIDPYQREALEHWIVSDWLADKLTERGEMVSKDIHDLTIWGRSCTGQAILLDEVICQIYDGLHPWTKTT